MAQSLCEPASVGTFCQRQYMNRVHYGLDDFVRDQGTFAYAARRDDVEGSLVRLEPGTAQQSRAETRANLMCPVPNCTAPEITTVDRSSSGHRDGFRHLRRGNGDHSGEGFHHRQAKAAVLDWANDHPLVRIAAAEVSVGDRVADVLLEGFGGFVIAVEIQYASLDVNSWRLREQSYRSEGVTPVWLWGHTGHHGPGGSGTTKPRAVHREVLMATNPLLWINPYDETIAWAATRDGQLPEPDSPVVSPQIAWLDSSLDVSSRGIAPSGWLEAHQAWLKAAEEEARRVERLASLADAERKRRADEAERARRWRQTIVRQTQPGPDPVCDVCKFPVRPGDLQIGTRHEVCAYGL